MPSGLFLQNREGQSTLEMTFALIAAFILIFAVLRFFIWVNKAFVLQNHDYELTRTSAASYQLGQNVDYTQHPDFKIFDNE